MLNPLVAGIVMQLTAVVSTPKNITLVQMANDAQLLPYSAQFIIRSVPSLRGSAILLGSTIRQCGDKLALEACDLSIPVNIIHHKLPL